MKSYEEFVAQSARLLAEARQLPLGTFPFPQHPAPAPNAPKALIFSPHPDDEIIVGALPVRLIREAKVNVVNVAVTQGSNKARQPGRWKELQDCCRYIGFGLIQTQPGGLDGINLKTRTQNQTQWKQSVRRIVEILKANQPQIILFPHETDWNSSHVGTHYLLEDALQELGPQFVCTTIETEFWGALDDPNIMVESTERDIADLITALSFHVGEVQRNPYHVRFPAWLMDNVRRGAELVGGQGGAAPEFPYATLYRVRRWKNGRFERAWEGGKILSRTDSPAFLLQDGF